MPETLRATTPADIVAVVPRLMGFHPRESIVMLTFGAQRSFHARVDLPRTAADVDSVVDALAAPCRLHAVQRVLVVGYAEQDLAETLSIATDVASRLGPDVIDVLAVSSAGFLATSHPETLQPLPGVENDLALAAITDPNVLGSREDRAASVQPGDDQLDGTHLLRAIMRVSEDDGWVDPLEAQAAIATAVEIATSDHPPADEDDLAAFIASLSLPHVRDAVLATVCGGETAEARLPFWTAVARRLPRHPAAEFGLAVAGVCAHQRGDGALAWCLVDRIHEFDGKANLTRLLETVLNGAVAPQVVGEAILASQRDQSA